MGQSEGLCLLSDGTIVIRRGPGVVQLTGGSLRTFDSLNTLIGETVELNGRVVTCLSGALYTGLVLGDLLNFHFSNGPSSLC